MFFRSGRALVLGACYASALSFFQPGFAQAADYTTEYQNKIRLAGTVDPSGDSPFGESIDLYTGKVSFRQIDLVLSGTGPDIVIARSSESGDIDMINPMQYSGFGDWDLEVPEIVTVAPAAGKNSAVGLWKTHFDPNDWYSGTFQRCTHFGSMWTPPPGYAGVRTGGIDSYAWWHGYDLRIPGKDGQVILARKNAPGPSSGHYPGVTAGHWQVGCLAQTANGEPGEGFLVISPDGTKYWLNRLIYQGYVQFREDDPYAPPPANYSIQPRVLARMQATRIEDRFGNFVEYHYTGDKLTAITASDGRSVAIDWWSDAPLVRSVTANGRQWTYEYVSRSPAGGGLVRVVLPDGSAWTFSGSPTRKSFVPILLAGCVASGNVYYYATNQLYMQGMDSTFVVSSPTGATGAFHFTTMLKGRSYYPSWCSLVSGQYVEGANSVFLAFSLVQRSISGPGVAPRIWNYSYEPAKPSVARYCTSNECQSTTYTEVTAPDGTRTRYTHSTRFGALQGRLLHSEVYSGSTLASASTMYYNFAESDQPYPGDFGAALGTSDAPYSLENLVLIRKTVNNIDGRNFVWEVPNNCNAGLNGYCFDAFGRPTRVVKGSTP